MSLWGKLAFWRAGGERTIHLRHGALGERAAKRFLARKGLRFLTANFRGHRGEIDLVFRDGPCLVFVEVKTRSEGGWTRPEQAVTKDKRAALTRAANDYLRMLEDPRVPYRFDIVEVILRAGAVAEVRHIENSFARCRGTAAAHPAGARAG